MTDFYALTAAEQSPLLLSMAQAALPHWGIKDARLTLIKYRENAVYDVIDQQGQRYALRIHRSGYHSDLALNSELKWLIALHASGLSVTRVVPTKNGDLMVLGRIEGVPEARQIDLFAWVDGQQLGSIEAGLGNNQNNTQSIYDVIGQKAACLHNQAVAWTLPVPFERHAWDADGLVGDEPLWGRFWELGLLTEAQKNLISDARIIVRDALQALPMTAPDFGLIHADLVPENLLVEGGEVHLIDFDDCGFGWHMFELATALYFLRDDASYELAKDSLIAGYQKQRALSEQQLGQLELFLTARGFTYLGWIISRQETQTAKEFAPALIRLACQQARRFLMMN